MSGCLVSLRSARIRKRGPPVTAGRRQPGTKPEAKHAPFRTVRPQHGEDSAMALSKVIAAMTCTAPHSVLLKCTAGELPFCGGEGHWSAVPGSTATAVGRTFPQDSAPLPHGRLRTACSPSVSFCPQPQEKHRRGEGTQEHRRRLSGSAARGSPCPGLGLPGRCRPPAAAARCSSGGTEGRGRHRARHRPRPLPAPAGAETWG